MNVTCESVTIIPEGLKEVRDWLRGYDVLPPHCTANGFLRTSGRGGFKVVQTKTKHNLNRFKLFFQGAQHARTADGQPLARTYVSREHCVHWGSVRETDVDFCPGVFKSFRVRVVGFSSHFVSFLSLFHSFRVLFFFKSFCVLSFFKSFCVLSSSSHSASCLFQMSFCVLSFPKSFFCVLDVFDSFRVRPFARTVHLTYCALFR